MTTGNVNRASFIIDTIATGSLASQPTNTGNDFKKIIDDVNAPADNTVKKASTGTSVNNSKVRDNVRHDSQKTVDEDVITTDELVSDIRNAVKEVLNISDEELEQAMAELGINVIDLLVPQNAAELISIVKDTSVVEIVTDEELSGFLTEINSKITDIVGQFADENKVSFEQVVNLVTEKTENSKDLPDELINVQNVPEEMPEEKSDLHEEQSIKIIDVTIDNSKVDSDETGSEGSSMNFESHSDKTDKHDGNTLAQNVISNLTEAVNASVENLSEIAGTDKVDGIDIVRQIVDAVRVNITEEVQSLEISLNPESLGKINLTVTAKDGILTATIATQNENVKNAIENQITMLKEQLNNQGIKVQEVEVTVANHGFGSNMDNNHNENGTGNKSNTGKRFRGIDELTEEEPATGFAENELIDSNISLKA